MYFETERIMVRDYRPEDKECYITLKRHEETMYYLQDILLSSHQEGEEDFVKVLADMDAQDRKYYFFHMVLKATGEQLGSIGYTVLLDTPVGKLVHAGYFIYPQYWNKGYVTEAFKRLLEFAFMENHVYRVTTGCLLENKASEKIMKKAGMIKEAEHVDWEWFDGGLKTRVEYRLLKEEWQNRKKTSCMDALSLGYP